MKNYFYKKLIALSTIGAIGLTTLVTPLFADAEKPCNNRHQGFKSGMMGHGSGFNKNKFSERFINTMVQELELSSSQRDAAFSTLDEYRPKLRATHFAIVENHKAITALDPASAEYNEKIATLADEQSKLIAQQIKFRAAIRANFVNLLTPEQKTKLKKNQTGHAGKGKHERYHGTPGTTDS